MDRLADADELHCILYNRIAEEAPNSLELGAFYCISAAELERETI